MGALQDASQPTLVAGTSPPPIASDHLLNRAILNWVFTPFSILSNPQQTYTGHLGTTRSAWM